MPLPKVSKIRIFTFTGHPESLSLDMMDMFEAHRDKCIDILEVTESMTTRAREDGPGLEPVLHYTMLYRLS